MAAIRPQNVRSGSSTDNEEMGCRIDVRVTPRASRDRIEIVDEVIKIWTTAAPTDGQANEAVRKQLAKRLGMAPSKLNLIRGDTSREKTFEIEGLSREEVWSKFAPA